MGETRFIVAGSFIDGSGAEVRRNVFLAVTDTIITAIGSAADLPRDDGAAIDDFSHCIILPALVDCSVSLTRSPSVDRQVRLAAEEADPAEKAAMVERHISYCHAYGVLGVADSDDLSGLVERYQEGMAQGSIIDIRTSGRLCRSRQDCAAGNPAGGDFLKIGYSANIEDEEAPYLRLDQEDLGRILQHRGGRKAVVVANGRQQVAEALAAGCDAIEQGYGMGEDNLRKMAEKDVLWIPSVLRAKNGLDGAGSGGDVCLPFLPALCGAGKAGPRRGGLLEKDARRTTHATASGQKIGRENGGGNRCRQCRHPPWRVDGRGDEIVHQGRLFTGGDHPLRLGKWRRILRHGEAGSTYGRAEGNIPDYQGHGAAAAKKTLLSGRHLC